MGARSRTGKSSKPAPTKSGDAAPKKEPAKENAKDPSRWLWGKVVDKDVELSAEEALQAAHWIRQVFAVITGLLFGFVPFQGAPAILTYLVFSTFAPPAILRISNEIDVEEISKVASIQFEGFMPSFALFMLTWIISYTVFLPPS